MRARSNAARSDPAMLDRTIAYVRDDVMTAYQAMPGFVGLSVLVDRDTGRGITTSAWESAEAMHATDAVAEENRQQVRTLGGADGVQVDEWDVALVHRAHETREGACARVIWARGTAPVDEALGAFRSLVLPALEQMPGFCSVSVLVDREGGRAVACTVYDSREALEGNASAAAPVRQRFQAGTGMTVDDIATFEVALAHLRVPETV